MAVSIISRLLVLCTLATTTFVSGDQYTFTLPVYIYPFSPYSSYGSATNNQTFLSYFNMNVVNMMMNAGVVKKESFQEVFEASTYELTASTSELNLKAAKLINRMWARDFINDLNMYRMIYIHQRYLCASQQLMKEPIVNPTFLDIPFDEPLDKMIVYHWAYHLHQSYETFMENSSKLHSKWQGVKEQINIDRTPEE